MYYLINKLICGLESVFELSGQILDQSHFIISGVGVGDGNTTLGLGLESQKYY